MGRIFRRGELKEAIVIVLLGLGEAHGYAIMTELKDRIGGGWKPSPGAIYPALLALVEMGYVQTTERDGTRIYSLTEAGLRAAQSIGSTSRWTSLIARSESVEGRITIGSLLDRFAAESSLRRRLVGHEKKQQVDAILARASDEIDQALKKGEADG
jgi:DNA-binding PadR family transcriptional regulator